MRDESKSTFISITLPLVAIVVSGIALIFTFLQYRVTRDQLLLSMKPSINFDTEYDPDELPAGIKIDDAGPGPAVIQSVTYYVDKKAIGDDPDKLVAFVNLSDSDNISVMKLEKGDTLAVGENEWLFSYKPKAKGKQEQKYEDRFMDLLDRHIAVEVQFCSVLGTHCDKKCSTDGWCD